MVFDAEFFSDHPFNDSYTLPYTFLGAPVYDDDLSLYSFENLLPSHKRVNIFKAH